MAGLDAKVEPPEIKPNTRYHVGVSGGKDSAAALLWMINESGVPKDKIIASFSDIGNDHDWTKAHVKLLSETVHPIETIYPDWGDLDESKTGERLGFFDLALHKKRFPSTKARFCTEFLKIYATERHFKKLRQQRGFEIIAVSGVRADESDDRSKLTEWDFNGNLFVYSWRPLIRWTIDDVFAIHKKYNTPLNPLYALGALRVGCWPCIMSRKSEIRMIALKFPERIDEIRRAELEFEKRHGRFSSFFGVNICPERFKSKEITTSDGRKMKIATIDDVVKWSMTGKKAQGHFTDDDNQQADEDHKAASCSSGFCE